MILSPNWHTRTSVTGLSVFLAAAVSSGAAWFRARQAPGVARLAAWLTVLEAFLFLDALFNWRWMLHSGLMHFAMAHGQYEQRQYVQAIALVLLGALFIYSVRFAARRQRSRAGAIAACSGVAAMACWFIEIISLHAIDVVFYHEIGGFMVIAFIWIVLSATIAISIQIDAAHTPA